MSKENEASCGAVGAPVDRPVRPPCFEFAMDFLGGPEDEQVQKYMEALEAWADAAVTAERERLERELFITRTALVAIRSHWREFGPECGFDETLEEACKVLEA